VIAVQHPVQTPAVEATITSQQPYTPEEIKGAAKQLLQSNKAANTAIIETFKRLALVIKNQSAAMSKSALIPMVLDHLLKDPILAALVGGDVKLKKMSSEIRVLNDKLQGAERALEAKNSSQKADLGNRRNRTRNLLNGLKKALLDCKKDWIKGKRPLLILEGKVAKGLNPSSGQLKKAQEYLDALGKKPFFQALIQGDESIKKAHAENVRMTTSLRGHLDKAAEEAQKRKMHQKKTSDDMIQMLQDSGVLKQQRANNWRAMASKILAMPSSTKAVNLPETEKGQDKERQLAQRLASALLSAPKYKETDWTNEVAPVVTDWFDSLSPSNQSVVSKILGAGGKSQPYGEIQFKKDLKDQNEPSGAKRSPLRDKAVQG
jgi:hypothetical protein